MPEEFETRPSTYAADVDLPTARINAQEVLWRFQEFEQRTHAEEQTDTGEAWDMMYVLRDELEMLLKLTGES